MPEPTFRARFLNWIGINWAYIFAGAIVAVVLVWAFAKGHIRVGFSHSPDTPSVAAPAASIPGIPDNSPFTIVIDGHTVTAPPGSTLVYDSVHTGSASTKTTDRSISYVDWSSAASVAGMLAENVDWKALLTGPLGWASGAVGLLGAFGTHKALKLHASHHQSVGRNQLRAAQNATPAGTKP
jgi:hypothetical protein